MGFQNLYYIRIDRIIRYFLYSLAGELCSRATKIYKFIKVTPMSQGYFYCSKVSYKVTLVFMKIVSQSFLDDWRVINTLVKYYLTVQVDTFICIMCRGCNSKLTYYTLVLRPFTARLSFELTQSIFSHLLICISLLSQSKYHRLAM